MRAVKAQEVLITVENKVGALTHVLDLLTAADINIKSVSAWVVDNMASFRLITAENLQAQDVLSGYSYSIEEKDVVVVVLPDQIGELKGLTVELKEADIDILYLYGTTSKSEKDAILIFSTNNNDKAVEVLNSKCLKS